jgi:hypothetical protein
LSANGFVWSARGSWSTQHQDHQFGEVIERDDHDTGFAEVTVRHAIAHHTVVVGGALEHDRFQPLDTPQFAYSYTTPGVFVQDDVDVARWLAVRAVLVWITTMCSGPFSVPVCRHCSAKAGGRAACLSGRVRPGHANYRRD